MAKLVFYCSALNLWRAINIDDGALFSYKLRERERFKACPHKLRRQYKSSIFVMSVKVDLRREGFSWNIKFVTISLHFR